MKFQDLKQMADDHIQYLEKYQKLSPGTIKQKSKAIEDFLMHVGVKLAILGDL